MVRSRESLVDRLSAAARMVARDVAAVLEPELGLTVDQWRVLRRLDLATATAMGDLAETVALPAATVTRLVDALIDRGLAFRVVAAEDRRRVVVLLSEDGHETLARAEELAAASEQRYLAGLTHETREALLPLVGGTQTR